MNEITRLVITGKHVLLGIAQQSQLGFRKGVFQVQQLRHTEVLHLINENILNQAILTAAGAEITKIKQRAASSKRN